MSVAQYAASRTMFGPNGLERYDLRRGDVLLEFPSQDAALYWLEDEGPGKFYLIGKREYQRIMDLHEYEATTQIEAIRRRGVEPDFVSRWLERDNSTVRVFFPEIPALIAKEDHRYQAHNFYFMSSLDGKTLYRCKSRLTVKELTDSGNYLRVNTRDAAKMMGEFPAGSWEDFEDKSLLPGLMPKYQVQRLEANSELLAASGINDPQNALRLAETQAIEAATLGKPLGIDEVRSELIKLLLVTPAPNPRRAKRPLPDAPLAEGETRGLGRPRKIRPEDMDEPDMSLEEALLMLGAGQEPSAALEEQPKRRRKSTKQTRSSKAAKAASAMDEVPEVVEIDEAEIVAQNAEAEVARQQDNEELHNKVSNNAFFDPTDDLFDDED